MKDSHRTPGKTDLDRLRTSWPRASFGARTGSSPARLDALDPYSQAVVNLINASGVVPFRRFHPVEARQELLKLRAPRPEPPVHPMASVTEEMIPAPDREIKVRILRPRLPAVAVNDAYAALEWVDANALHFGVDPSPPVLAGTAPGETS